MCIYLNQLQFFFTSAEFVHIISNSACLIFMNSYLEDAGRAEGGLLPSGWDVPGLPEGGLAEVGLAETGLAGEAEAASSDEAVLLLTADTGLDGTGTPF